MKKEKLKKQRQPRERASYRGIRIFARVGSPVFSALALLFGLTAALLLLVIPVVFFVNVPPQDMVLPPYLQAVREAGVLTGYDVIVGGGVRFTVSADTVTLADIKTAIYAFAFLGVLVSLELCAVSAFLARLASGIKHYGPLDRRNADVVNFIGLTVIVANICSDAVYRLLNYTLLKTFSAESASVRYVFGIPTAPLLLGLFILLLGFLYGYACVSAPAATSVPELTEGEDVGKPDGDDQPV